jgi:predicted TIM-barrel fold metal-dependent hydrolase
MKFLKKIVVLFFVLSYLFLLLWFFDFTRYKMIGFFWKVVGFPFDLKNPDYQIYVPVQLFRPKSMLVVEKIHLPSKPKFPLVEFHGHSFNISEEELIRQMEKTHTKIFVDLALKTTTLNEYNELQKKYAKIKERYLIFPGLNWKRLEQQNNKDGIRLMAQDLEEIAKNQPIKGIKLWKDFGLMRKKSDGTYWRLDDPAFDPIWDVCQKYRLIVAIHTADPPAFFSPIDEYNERLIELSRRPEWSFYGKGYPSFDEVMNQRENLFKRRRDVIFVALHFAEFAHDLARAKKLLDENPNVYVDIAQRIDELGRQPRSSRKFFIEYQDRILYGIDGTPNFQKAQIYWRFLETEDEYFDYYPNEKSMKGLWKIYGISLPDEVLEKIYYKNALKLLRINENIVKN